MAMGCAQRRFGASVALTITGGGITMLRALALCFSLGVSGAALAETPQRLAGLQDAARITIDDEGIAHVRASNEHDLYFMQGWVHAGDRLFQMDYNRRLASGTLAELVGTAALASDVQLRTLGLRRGTARGATAASAAWNGRTKPCRGMTTSS